MDSSEQEQENQELNDQESIYTSFGLDQSIIKPDVKTNIIYKKAPKYKEKIEYAKDEDGNLMPVYDEGGNIIRDTQGNIEYKIKGVKRVKDGTTIKKKVVSAPNFATINRTTSNLNEMDIPFLEQLDLQDSYLLVLQEMIEKYNHTLANTLFRHNVLRTSIETLKKGYRQVTVQAIKTFITKTEGKKVNENIDASFQPGNEKQNKNLFGGLQEMARERNKLKKQWGDF